MTKRILLLVAALALVAAACSTEGGDGVATLSNGASDVVDDSGAAGDVTPTDEEALMAFSACMRENGVPDFEDPIINADGSVEFSIRGGGGGEAGPFGDVDRETVESAFTACSEELDGLALGPGGGGFDAAEFEDRFVEFAACMRDNGVAMDDPDFSAFGPGQRGEGGGPFGSLDLDDPTVQAALETCQELFADFAPRIGRGEGRGAQG